MIVRNAVVIVADLLTANPDGQSAIGIIVNRIAGDELDPSILSFDIVGQTVGNRNSRRNIELKVFIRRVLNSDAL